MIKKIKQMFITLIATVSLVAPFALAPVAHAAFDPQAPLCSGTGGELLTANDDCTTDPDAENKINSTVTIGLNLFSAIVGIIAVVMIIIGGVKYITSGGESANVTTAKNTILYAVIGLVIVALSQIIVRFVLKRFVGN